MNFNSKYLLALIPLALVFAVLFFFSDIVVYIVVAWVFSMVGAPMMRFLKRFMNRSLAAIITLISFVMFFFLLVWIFVPSLVVQARNLASIDYEKIVKNVEEPLNDWNEWMIKKGLVEPQGNEEQTAELKKQSQKEHIQADLISIDSLLRANGDTTHSSNIALLIEIHNDPGSSSQERSSVNEDRNLSIVERAQKEIISVLNPGLIPSLFGSVVGFLGNSMIAILSILFITFFFLREQGLFGNIISSIVPDKFEQQSMTALDDSSRLLIRYFIGVGLQVTVITLFIWIALSILGVKNALLIGFFAALMNVIPYLGPMFGAVFAVIITISSQVDMSFYDVTLPRIGKVIIVFAIMQMMDNFILQPTIFGKSVKAHPLEIFLVVLIGAKLGGIIGMVIAIPSYTVLRVIGKVFFSEFKVVNSITKSI